MAKFQTLALAAASFALVASLTACGGQQTTEPGTTTTPETTTTPTETAPPADTTGDTGTTTTP